MIASFSQYLPLGDLWKIVIACLVVALVAPTSVAIAIAGLDRRAEATEHHRSQVPGDLLVVLGAAILAALIGAGIYALVNR